jgi:hypothetical protein
MIIKIGAAIDGLTVNALDPNMIIVAETIPVRGVN